MFLYWQQSMTGKLWISEKSLSRLMEQVLPEGYRCESISLWNDQNALNIKLGYPGRSFLVDDERLGRIAEDLKNVFYPMGFREIFVTWGQSSSFSPEWGLGFLRNGFFWGALCAVVGSLSLVGFLQTLYLLLWGGLGYGVARIFLGKVGQSLFQTLRRIMKG